MSKFKLIFGEAVEEMSKIDNNSIGLVLADIPYGTTACKWDEAIPFDDMWREINRVKKQKSTVLLFGSEPFASRLRMSNIDSYKYDWVWEKSKGSNFTHAKNMPLKFHETISVFSDAPIGHASQFGDRRMPYFPQGLIKVDREWSRPRKYESEHKLKRESHKLSRVIEFTNYPKSILKYSNSDNRERIHPTQKPVSLMEYLVLTYTEEGDTVLDFTCGSGSTLVACNNTDRNGIGIDNGCCEKDKIVNGIQIKGLRWVEIAQLRLDGKM